jgi:hypothetical protein
VGDALINRSEGERHKAIVLLIVTTILWSSGGLLIKSVSWNPVAIAGARSAIAALLLLAYVRRPHLTWSSAQIGGAIAYAVTVFLFITAYRLTPAVNVILLQYGSPICVALLSARFLGERAMWMDRVAMALVIGGMHCSYVGAPPHGRSSRPVASALRVHYTGFRHGTLRTLNFLNQESPCHSESLSSTAPT